MDTNENLEPELFFLKIKEALAKLDVNNINDIDDIRCSKYKKIRKTYTEYEIKYNKEISSLLEKFYFTSSKSQTSSIYSISSSDFSLQIKLDERNFNRMTFKHRIPFFMKRQNLGKIIFKKLIKDFNYITCYNNYNFYSNMDLNLDLIDSDIFSFSNEENIISFWKDYNFNKIVNVLKEFFTDSTIIKIDNNFLIKYSLDEETFIEKYIK